MKFTNCIEIVGNRPNSFEGEKRYISTGALDVDHIDENSVEIITYEDRPSRADLSVNSGDVIFAKMAGTKKNIVIDDDTENNIYSTGFFAVSGREKVITSKCLYYLVGSELFLKQKDKHSSGATQRAITNKGLENIIISVPDYSEQEKIVSQLDRVASIIEKRRREIDLLDDLIKARFVEMFGTYPANEKGWEIGTIRDLVTDVRYGSSRKAADGKNGKYPYLRMNNITYGGELDLSDTKTIDIPDNELSKCSVRRGDVLFNRTNSRELVGKTCVYNRDELMVLAGFVIRVRLNEKMLPEVLSAFLNTDFSKRMLLGLCKEAIGQANINAQEMQDIGIYLPPLKLQKEFVEFKKQLDKSKVVAQQMLDEAQKLFDSLMQEYFG